MMRGDSFNHHRKTRIIKDGKGSVATSVNEDDKLDKKSTFLHV
jgi:hypothetical protein